MRWEGRVARLEERKGTHRVRDLLKVGRIILKLIFKKNELGRARSTFGGEKRYTQI